MSEQYVSILAVLFYIQSCRPKNCLNLTLSRFRQIDITKGFSQKLIFKDQFFKQKTPVSRKLPKDKVKTTNPHPKCYVSCALHQEKLIALVNCSKYKPKKDHKICGKKAKTDENEDFND